MFSATSGIDLHVRTVELLTATGFSLAAFCFWCHARNPEVAWLLVDHWLPVLHGSVAFGLLFVFARYKKVNVNGAVEYVLDTRHAYTKTIFMLRRILLAGALGIGLTVVADGLGTSWSTWALAFTGVFVASIPLHILHKQIPSMVSELATQVVAIYGCWIAFGIG